MNVVIKLKPEELDNKMLVKIKELIGGRKDIEVAISLTDSKTEYLKTLNRSVGDLNFKNSKQHKEDFGIHSLSL